VRDGGEGIYRYREAINGGAVYLYKEVVGGDIQTVWVSGR
jgi:hypothetical protein